MTPATVRLVGSISGATLAIFASFVLVDNVFVSDAIFWPLVYGCSFGYAATDLGSKLAVGIGFLIFKWRISRSRVKVDNLERLS